MLKHEIKECITIRRYLGSKTIKKVIRELSWMLKKTLSNYLLVLILPTCINRYNYYVNSVFTN